MEKTYRHRKTGYIATQLEKDSFIYKYDCGLPLSCYIKQEMLEDSCDWEKVIHKDYEILSFRANTGLLRIKDSNGVFQANGDAKRENTTEQYLLNEGGWDIYSVKRLSDGEVFSIGDKIYFRGLYGNNSEHKYDTIRGFDLKQDANLGILYHNGLVGLNKIEKYREAILTTEDGINIFQGDSYYYVNKNNFYIDFVVSADKKFDSKKEDMLDFKYKENAEEWVLRHRPLLSLNDLLSVWGNDDNFDAYTYSPMFQNFKNLAKTKL